MPTELIKLLRNLRAGMRLAFMLRVSRVAFRIDLVQLLLLFILSALLDIVADNVRYGPDAYFSLFGAGGELFAAALMMASAALLSIFVRQPALALAIPVLVLSGYPAIQLAHIALAGALRWSPAPVPLALQIDWAIVVWAVALFVRAVALSLAPGRGHRWAWAIAGGLLLASPMWFAPFLMPTEPWWRQTAIHGGADPRYPSPASEPVIAAQLDLLDDALAMLDDERAGVTDLYFIGFGGDAKEDVFRKDVLAAQQVMDERWDTEDRSILLINNPRTLLDTPIATVSNLRTTLNEIGAAINVDEDVVMVYIATHGSSDHVLAVSLPPLELAQLSPATLRTMLDESGIKWRIIVISACYAGGFIDALKDDHTLVMTAARADRTSFGCGNRSDSTYFGEALFQQGLAKSDSILSAFEVARRRVAEREAETGMTPPSNPQQSVGAAMEEKLKELEKRGAARRAGRSI